MKIITSVFREVAGLFVEDGSLALQIVVVVIISGVFARLFPDSTSAAGAILLFGCLGVLSANVARAARR
jgi:hypothetical protein